jgi:hypothetical protein
MPNKADDDDEYFGTDFIGDDRVLSKGLFFLVVKQQTLRPHRSLEAPCATL